MPKAKRFFRAGHHYHLTHRCHGRSFLLKFAKDRETYRDMLRERLSTYRLPLLGYCITSNHVHLLVTARDEQGISRFMDAVEGDFAQYYNLRKKRSGAFWGGRYAATAVDGLSYLWNCMTYIELNMVRAGVVAHPAEWRWCSYGELMGHRQRYRLVDPQAVTRATGQDPLSASFRKNYRTSIAMRIRRGGLQRNPAWTESLAVGSKAYVQSIAAEVKNRVELETEPDEEAGTKAWVLRESRPRYA